MFNHRFSFVVLTASIRVPVPFVIRCKDLQCNCGMEMTILKVTIFWYFKSLDKYMPIKEAKLNKYKHKWYDWITDEQIKSIK